MCIVVAIAAGILVIALIAVVFVFYRRDKLRRASIDRPAYLYLGDYSSIADWQFACRESLAWSHKRRNKEVE